MNNEDGLGSVKVVRRRTTLNQYIENWPQSRCMAFVCERNRSQLNTDADQDLRRVAGCQGPGFDKELPSQGGMLIRDPSHVVDLKLNSSLSGDRHTVT